MPVAEIPQLERALTTLIEWAGVSGVVLTILWALSMCFLGYVLLRIELIPIGLYAGVLLGVMLAEWARAEPSGLDYLIACFTLAVLLGLAGWLLHRVVFALWTLGAVACLIAAGFGTYDSLGTWVFGGMVGLVLAAGVLVYTRPAIIVVCSLIGSVLCVTGAMLLIVGDLANPFGSLREAMSQRWTLATVVIVMGILTAAGILVQNAISHRISPLLMPPPGGRKSSGRRSVQGVGKHPRFTKL